MHTKEIFKHFIVVDKFEWFSFNICAFSDYFKIDISKINDESESFFDLLNNFERKECPISCMRLTSAEKLCKLLNKYIKILEQVRLNNVSKI